MLKNKYLWIGLIVIILLAGGGYYLYSTRQPGVTPIGQAGEPTSEPVDQSSSPTATAEPSPSPTERPTSTVPPEPTDEPAPEPTATSEPSTPAMTIAQALSAEITPLETFMGHSDDITEVAISPTNDILASSSLDGTVRMWRIQDGGLIGVLEGHTGPVWSLSFSSDGTLLASGSDDRTVRVWQVSDGTLIKTINSSFVGRVIKVVFAPDRPFVAFGGHQCVVALYHATSAIIRRSFPQPRCLPRRGGSVQYWGLAFSEDGRLMATGEGQPGGNGGSVQIWEVDQIAPPRLVRGYDLVVRDLDLSKDGNRLALALRGSPDIWLLNAADGTRIHTLSQGPFRVSSVAFSPDDALIASGSRDGVLRLWDAESGALLRELEGHTESVESVAFSNDGTLIASGGTDDTVILWALTPR